jgi:hypothetical protein
MSPLAESLVFLGVLLAGAMLGMAISLLVPEHHRNEGTRSHFTATISVVATLAAFVLGLAISNANTARLTMTQDVVLLSSDIVRVDGLLRQIGPDADAARGVLVRYAVQRREDLFPQAANAQANLANPASDTLLNGLQERLLELKPRDDAQHWRLSQMLELSNQMAATSWAIAEQRHASAPQGVVLVVTFWLAILFGTYGMFTPRHATAVAALFLCATAVAAAVFVILDAGTPFSGLIRISPASLVDAVDIVRR